MNEEKDKKTYELALLLKNESDLTSVLTLLRGHSGELLSEPRAKKIALAYKIKGNTEGIFAYCIFRASSEDAKNLEHDLVTKQEVIRSMILVAPAISEKQSATTTASFSPMKQGRPATQRTTMAPEAKTAMPRPLSNEALEKKIEEILQ